MVQPSCCAQCHMLVYCVSCNCVILNNDKGGQINFSVIKSWTGT